MNDDYLAINRANWDERAPAHAASPGYAVTRFASEPTFLSGVVEFDKPRLGDISGLRGLHLQCHIGTDTVSLARLGATMTGLDFSFASLEQARRVAAIANVEATFVQSNLYDAVDALRDQAPFDLIYTGVGALCWLPNIGRWASVVRSLLRPGGRLFLREGHPMLWSIDERIPKALQIEFPYFETADPLVWDEAGTYVATDTEFTHTVSHSWNHGLGEIMTALLENGLTITQFAEHDSVPWDALHGQMTEGADGEWRLNERPARLPLSYTLEAVKTR